jgi:hypothetical protein
MSRSTFSVLFYVNRGKEKGGTTRLSVSGRVPRHYARCGDGWHQALRSAREMATSKHRKVIWVQGKMSVDSPPAPLFVS